ncbi:CsxC family protein [Bacillus marinisedimentorum]|uniref:CsxC family protein n=1 Tax=Bacillus marinisedimentorum TaxID=1821260 RepID=UPI000872184A|nr:hypothetical protein [Bacillus marinisedimentorum]
MPLSKIPVVLAEQDVSFTIDEEIVFPEPVLEIKKVKKRLKLTQCRLMLPTNTILLMGFIRKNIQYATPVVGDDGTVTSNIRSFTVDIPFTEDVDVDEFINMPAMLGFNQSNEFGFLRNTPLPATGFSSKDTLMANDLSEFDVVYEESFNELPYCELTGTARFVEYDEALDRTQGVVIGPDGDEIDAPFEEGTFTTIIEKMVVNFTVKVLQLQQINVGEEDNGNNDDMPYPHYNQCKKHDRTGYGYHCCDMKDGHDENARKPKRKKSVHYGYNGYDHCDKKDKCDHHDKRDKCDYHDKRDKCDYHDKKDKCDHHYGKKRRKDCKPKSRCKKVWIDPSCDRYYD